jgi:hypothetical protein
VRRRVAELQAVIAAKDLKISRLSPPLSERNGALSSGSSNQTQMGNTFLVELLDGVGDGGLQVVDGSERLMRKEVALPGSAILVRYR